MDENILHLESFIPSTNDLHVEYNGNEGKVILKIDNAEEWFDFEDFKRFIEQLKDFAEVLETKVVN